MAAHQSSGGNIVVSLLLFLTTAALAILLLLTAAVTGLTLLLDSLVYASLILGALFAVAAAVIYLLCVRKPLSKLREQFSTVYEVARLAHDAYEWVADKLRWIRAIWNASDE